MDLGLNPELDRAALAQAYRTDNRIQIRDVLRPESAQAVLEALHGVPWNLVFRDGNTVVEMTPEQLRALTPQQAGQIRQVVDRGAQSGFQFFYNNYPLLQDYSRPGRQDRDIFRAYEFLNSAPVLDFLREVTGLHETRWVDAHGALYQANHFLKYHTDESETEPRLAAYVLSFAQDWDLDWGGLLQFWNEDDDVEFALRPRFNALNIFTVPRRHSVSAVASYAPARRFSITGWLRADEPPFPIPWQG